jgi:hypothetical protein
VGELDRKKKWAETHDLTRHIQLDRGFPSSRHLRDHRVNGNQ